MNIEYDIKEILTDIKHSISKLDTKLDKVTEDVGELKTNLVRVELELKSDLSRIELELKGDLSRVEQTLKGEIKVLDEKVDGIGKRVDTQEFINRGVIVGLVLTILGGFAKLFGLR